MEQTMAKNRTRLVLAMISVVIAATLSLGLSAHPAEAMPREPGGYSCADCVILEP
jgi:hypothetical protein